MDKWQAVLARKAVITAINERADAATASASGAAVAFSSIGPSKLDRLMADAHTPLGIARRQLPYGSEIERICGMPAVAPMDNAELEEYNRANVLSTRFADGWRLFNVQAEAVSAYEMYGGAFCNIGVGFGKTLVSLMVAYKAYLKGKKKVLLIVPSQVYSQLTEVDIKWARGHVPFNCPVHLVGGKAKNERNALCKSGKKGLYILTYSFLSVKDTTEMLNDIRPELIICDEVHNLANRDSARTKRLMNYIDEHNPEGVVLSGTITSKTIRDYFHLIKWALKANNPLPNASQLANEWGEVIDANASMEAAPSGATGPLLPLIRWAQKAFPEERFGEHTAGFRKAFKHRLNSAPGVVSTGDAAIGTSLYLCNRKVEAPESCDGWKELSDLISKVEDMWLTPNDDEIEHAIHTWKWLYELNAGFYNELTWPEPQVYSARKKIGESEAKDILDKAREHHCAGQVYASALRKWLQEQSKPGLDTPFLVGADMAKHADKNVGVQLYDLWRDWKGLDFPARPDRDGRAIRVCPYKVNAAVSWARAKELDGQGAIIWVWHQELGEWCYEELKKSGIDALHCPAGKQHNDAIINHDNKNKVIVASINAHGEGKNLQHFQNNYFLQYPRDPKKAEQTMGRTHRNGQNADELLMFTNFTLDFDHMVFAATLNDALYIHQTTGTRQKLIYANYDPIPQIFPSAVLHERGLQNALLSKEQERILADKFKG